MNLFANLRIGARLALGFGVVLILSIVIATVGAWQLGSVANASRKMMELPIKKERMVSDWARYISVGIMRTTAIAKSTDASLAPFFAGDAAESTRASVEILKKLEPLLVTPEEKDLYAKVLEVRKAYVAGRDGVMKFKVDGQTEEAARLFEASYVPAAQSYQKLLADFIDLQRGQLDAEATHIDTVETASRRQLALLAAIVLGFGLLCAWRLTAGITRPLKDAMEAAHKIAGGDLTGGIQARSRDEIGRLMQSLKEMNDSLARVVSQVREGTGTIATASGEIAAGNMDLSSRTEQQAGSLEETASSMEELTSTVKQNADNALQANQLAQSASAVADKGGAVVAEVVTTMGAINASAKKIADIIAVIDGIAFQTNILALNAAVEAARAGEQGRGFAVVASEVRTLAQRSASAAKEIKELIGDSVQKVETGSQLVDQAGATMREIVESVTRVTDIMSEIAAASQEQTSGIEQVNQAIAQMDQVTQQNASLVEEAAAAAQSLNDQAGALNDIVSVFKLDGVHVMAATEQKMVLSAGRVSQTAAPVKVAKRPHAIGSTANPAEKVAAARPDNGDEWKQFQSSARYASTMQ